MAIRLREVNGRMVALCATRSVEKQGDVYLGDAMHHALSTKFALDFNAEGWPDHCQAIPCNFDLVSLMRQEESSNPTAKWTREQYGPWDTGKPIPLLCDACRVCGDTRLAGELEIGSMFFSDDPAMVACRKHRVIVIRGRRNRASLLDRLRLAFVAWWNGR